MNAKTVQKNIGYMRANLERLKPQLRARDRRRAARLDRSLARLAGTPTLYTHWGTEPLDPLDPSDAKHRVLAKICRCRARRRARSVAETVRFFEQAVRLLLSIRRSQLRSAVYVRAVEGVLSLYSVGISSSHAALQESVEIVKDAVAWLHAELVAASTRRKFAPVNDRLVAMVDVVRKLVHPLYPQTSGRFSQLNRAELRRRYDQLTLHAMDIAQGIGAAVGTDWQLTIDDAYV